MDANILLEAAESHQLQVSVPTARNLSSLTMWLVQVALFSIAVVACLLFGVSVTELLGPGYMPSVLCDALSRVIEVRMASARSVPRDTETNS